ncbi:hypothetical protein LXL04_006017 [Taraxacum kok-saghyz]
MGSEQQGIAMGKKEVATSRVFWRSSGSRSTSAEGRNGEENSEMGAAERRCGRDEEDAGGRRRWEKRDTVKFDDLDPLPFESNLPSKQLPFESKSNQKQIYHQKCLKSNQKNEQVSIQPAMKTGDEDSDEDRRWIEVIVPVYQSVFLLTGERRAKESRSTDGIGVRSTGFEPLHEVVG